MKAAGRVLLMLAAVPLGIAVAALFFPGPPARWAAERWASPRGWDIRFDDLRGNPFSGYRAEGLAVRGPGVDLTARSLAAALSWRVLRRERRAAVSLDIDTPILRLEPGARPSPSSSTKESPSTWPPPPTLISEIRVKNGALSSAGIDVSDIQATAGVSEAMVRLSSLRFSVAGHAVEAKGEAAFHPLRGEFRADISGPHAGRAAASGSAESWTGSLALRRGGEGTASITVRSRAGVLDAEGWIEVRGRIRGLRPAVEARFLRVEASAHGPPSSLSWTVKGLARELSMPDLRISRGEVTARGRGLPPQRVQAELRLEAADVRGRPVENARLSVEGTRDDHRFHVRAEGAGIAVAARGRGGMTGGRWHATWNSLDARWMHAWASTGPFRTVAAPGRFSIQGLSLRGEKGLVQLSGEFSNGAIRGLHLRTEGLALDPLHAHGWISQPVSGSLSLEARLEGTPARPVGEAGFRIDDFSVKGHQAGRISGRLRLTGRTLRWEGLDVFSPSGRLRVDGDIPWPFRGALESFTLRLRSDRFDPGPLAASLLDAKVKGGAVSADLTLSRRGGRLAATGSLRLYAEELRLPAWGEGFAPVSVVLVGAGDRLVVAEGNAQVKDGHVRLSGTVGREGPDLALEGRRMPFRAGPMTGKADADVSLTGRWRRPLLAGRIFIRRAEDKPVKKNKKARPATKEQAPPSPPSAWALDLALRADRDVWYKRGDTAVELKADLKIEKEAYGPPAVYGDVGSVRGDYFFYGRRFKIETGRALFAGESPPDPSLSLRAVHRAGEIDVVLTVGGTLSRPEMSLSSNPPLEETDIVSVLATGRPASSLRAPASGSEGEGAQAAAQGLVAGYLSGKMEDRLRERVPLDVMRVDLGHEGTAGVTVGKNVNERLYVAVEQTLGADGQRRLRSEYVLTRWLNLEGSSGSQGNYVVDLLFKFGFR